MSLCRWSEDSDLYIYSFGWGKFHCCLCNRTPDKDLGKIVYTDLGVLLHIWKHKRLGDQVPVKKIVRTLFFDTTLGYAIYRLLWKLRNG